MRQVRLRRRGRDVDRVEAVAASARPDPTRATARSARARGRAGGRLGSPRRRRPRHRPGDLHRPAVPQLRCSSLWNGLPRRRNPSSRVPVARSRPSPSASTTSSGWQYTGTPRYGAVPRWSACAVAEHDARHPAERRAGRGDRRASSAECRRRSTARRRRRARGRRSSLPGRPGRARRRRRSARARRICRANRVRALTARVIALLRRSPSAAGRRAAARSSCRPCTRRCARSARRAP